MALSLILGIVVGVVMGITGAGGGILAVPALVGGLGWTVQQAAPVALIAVASGAAIGALDGLRREQVRYRAAMLMAAVGIPCTSPGVLLAQRLPPQWLIATFAVLLLVLAARLIRRSMAWHRRPSDSESPLGRLHPVTGRFVWTWATGLLLAAIGGLAGFVSGLLGVGGGFIIVPLLQRFTSLSMQGIVPTSLLVIALVGTGGAISALLHGLRPPLTVTALFAAAAIGGTLIGRQFAQRLSNVQIQRGFATLLILVALGLLARTAMAG
ncbi:MAG: sulfite exporter TauE/SafE family protein [Burkholderiales bacterium]|nr:sulfite exporter TauE/SafE family protein [Burkholderiales bacterium]